MGVFDLLLKRSMVSFLRTYEATRLSGGSHSDGLQSVLRSYRALSRDQKQQVWARFYRGLPSLEESSLLTTTAEVRQAHLASLIFQMLCEYNGPWDDKTSSEIAEQTVKAFAENPIRWD